MFVVYICAYSHVVSLMKTGTQLQSSEDKFTQHNFRKVTALILRLHRMTLEILILMIQ